MYFHKKIRESKNVRNSATGTASQTPVRPNKFGKVNKHTTIQKNVLENDRIAERVPSESAVNNEEANRFVPAKT